MIGATKHERREIDRVIGPAQPRHVAVGEAPEQQHLDRGPARNADEEGAQDVVDVLALEPEDVGGMIGRELAVELELRALLAPHVEEQLDRAIHEEDRRRVHGVEPERPAPAQRLHRRRRPARPSTSRPGPSPCGTRSRETGSSAATSGVRPAAAARRTGAAASPSHGGSSRRACSGFRTRDRPCCFPVQWLARNWAQLAEGPCIQPGIIAILNELVNSISCHIMSYCDGET